MISQKTTFFGWFHLTYSGILTILLTGLCVILYLSTNDENLIRDLFSMNNEMSQFGTLLFMFLWVALIVVATTLFFLFIYLIVNIIFFMKMRRGNISLVIVIINLIISISMIGESFISIIGFVGEDFNPLYLLIFILGLIFPLSGILYSVFALKDRTNMRMKQVAFHENLNQIN